LAAPIEDCRVGLSLCRHDIFIIVHISSSVSTAGTARLAEYFT
jgi:hypothetical protein